MKIAFIFFALFFQTWASHAVLIQQGNTVYDSKSKLYWLNLDETLGQTYNEVSSRLASNGDLDGWRFATAEEFETLLINEGLTPETCSNSYNFCNSNVLAPSETVPIITLLGDTSNNNTPTEPIENFRGWSLGLLANGNTDSHWAAIVEWHGADTLHFLIPDNQVNQFNQAAFLVRELLPVNLNELPPEGDWDGDYVSNVTDNCILQPNSGQEDIDQDGYGDICDGDFNNDNIVGENDRLLISSLLSHGPAPYFQEYDFNQDQDFDEQDLAYFDTVLLGTSPGPSLVGDIDRDGILTIVDNCPNTPNPKQGDYNDNNIGDHCDDIDGDSHLDITDNCLLIPNSNQIDYDNDGFGNLCDVDLDNDGLVQSSDSILFNDLREQNNLVADVNNDGVVNDEDKTIITSAINSLPGPSLTGDSDGDSLIDLEDNCAGIQNLLQLDINANGIGALCDESETIIAGREFTVNDFAIEDRLDRNSNQNPAISNDALGNYVVVWESQNVDSVYSDIYARRYDKNDQALGASFKVNTTDESYEQDPAVHMADDGNFIVTWRKTSPGLYYQRFDANGNTVGEEIVLASELPSAAYGSAIAGDENGNFVVTWASRVNARVHIYATFVDAQDNTGPVLQVSLASRDIYPGAGIADRDYPSISYHPATGYQIAWASASRTNISVGGIYLRNINTIGAIDASETKLTSRGVIEAGYAHIAHTPSGDFSLAWREESAGNYDIFQQRFSSTKVPLGPDTKVNTFTGGIQSNPSIAFDNMSNSVLMWQSFNQYDAWDIVAQLFSPDGSRNGAEFRVNSNTEDWQDASTAVFDPDGNFLAAWDSGRSVRNTPVKAVRFGEDKDKDGVFDNRDNCPDNTNPEQIDINNNGIGDACEPDIDKDGIENEADNCPALANTNQLDSDADNIGDACDEDDDNDNIPDELDNCPLQTNSGQEDFDADGNGDICDDDTDEDGIDNTLDQCQFTHTEELVNPETGCSIAQSCDCSQTGNYWHDRFDHIKFKICANRELRVLVRQNIVERKERRQTLRHITKEHCPKPTRKQRHSRYWWFGLFY